MKEGKLKVKRKGVTYTCVPVSHLGGGKKIGGIGKERSPYKIREQKCD